MLKIYSNIITNFTLKKANKLKQLSLKYKFLIWHTLFSYENSVFLNEFTTNNSYYSWVDIIDISHKHDKIIF